MCLEDKHIIMPKNDWKNQTLYVFISEVLPVSDLWIAAELLLRDSNKSNRKSSQDNQSFVGRIKKGDATEMEQA